MEWPCTAVCETWLLNWNSLFWSGFSAVWGDVLSGCQVLVGSVLGPCHLWEFLYMRSADMCVWWRCVWVDRYYVLTFGSGGACSTKGSSDFWLLTLWSVDCCRIMCCVHHCVSLYCGWRNTACWDGAGDLSSWGGGSGKQVYARVGAGCYQTRKFCCWELCGYHWGGGLWKPSCKCKNVRQYWGGCLCLEL